MKLNIKTALKAKKNPFPIDTFHLTTLDFGRTIVSNIFEMEQGESVKGKFSQFFRLQPLAVPTYGNARIVTRAFCVPFRVVTRNWDNFFSDSGDSTLPKEQPFVTNDKIVTFFLFSGYNLATEVNVGSRADVTMYSQSSDVQLAFNFTEKGRWLFQILQGLGYSINWTTDDKTAFELRPLLAFMRCCYDYLYPSRWINGLGIGHLFDLDVYEDADIEIILEACINLLYVPYVQDNYNAAWLNFNSPTGATYDIDNLGVNGYSPSGSFSDLTRVTNSTDGVDYRQKEGLSTSPLSAYGLRLLQSVSDIVTRDNIAGKRFFERMKGMFGFVTQEQKHSYSQFLKSYNHSVNLMDVTATTGTDSQLLGEQAGKGYVTGDDSFSFEAKEHCYIIFITQVMPSIGYYQGRKPWTIYRDSRFKYYRPELDSLGMQPLRNDELFADYDVTHSPMTPPEAWADFLAKGGKPNGVFGFVPRYLEFKKGYDFVTGDFRLNSRNVGRDSYHTMRILPQPSSENPLSNNSKFNRVSDEYTRIFAADPTNEAGAKFDHFIGYFSFAFTKYSNKLSISESTALFNKSGRDVTLDYEGTQL